MNDLSSSLERPDKGPKIDLSRELQLGFVTREPLDTMLRLERVPPPMHRADTYRQSNTLGSNSTLEHGIVSNTKRLDVAEMNIKLAEVVISLEDEIAECGDQGVIDGFTEVFRFLQHVQHLRILQET